MNMNPIGLRSALSVQTLLDMRNDLTDLQRQIGTGKKADNYAGIGLGRGLAIGMRTQLSAITSYNDTTALADMRIKLANTAITEVDSMANGVKGAALKSMFALNGSNQTTDQRAALASLDQMLGVLNTQAGDRYLFSGKATDQPSVADLDQIMNGDGARAGFRQIVDERRQADLGVGNMGRLEVSAPTTSSRLLTEDVAGSPFGFKLAGAFSTLSNTTVTGPTGSPAGITMDFTGQPAVGETIELSFTLPDGTSQRISLKATDSATPGPGEFQIGATTDDTAANFEAAMNPAIVQLSKTQLVAASASAAGKDFFAMDDAHPPQRVNGPPFNTATSLVAGTSSNTVSWYTGEGGSDPARQTVTGRIDTSLTVSYGARANEEALRIAVQSTAVFAVMTFDGSDPTSAGAYEALKVRTATALTGNANQQRTQDILAELAGAQTAMKSASERHRQSETMLQNFLGDIEGVPQEEVVAKILALQTTLQATLQTTSMLLKTSLLNYI